MRTCLRRSTSWWSTTPVWPAARAGDVAPLVLAGHTHEPRRSSLGRSILLVEGSTGGSGLRGLHGATPEPLTCSVLYFNPTTKRLVAYDRITVEGLGQSGVNIERFVVNPPENALAVLVLFSGATGHIVDIRRPLYHGVVPSTGVNGRRGG